ncbi:jg16924 [Pararge aegeria aegeria]|uniref:Jg16924 protein n=1 Tax=Pararge aegeria aegeria TaxID=348720 RepID=A0A8S4SEJ5_9NEOP|nr:jg16924 [Pararge aegeria aegeria]
MWIVCVRSAWFARATQAGGLAADSACTERSAWRGVVAVAGRSPLPAAETLPRACAGPVPNTTISILKKGLHRDNPLRLSYS